MMDIKRYSELEMYISVLTAHFPEKYQNALDIQNGLKEEFKTEASLEEINYAIELINETEDKKLQLSNLGYA